MNAHFLAALGAGLLLIATSAAADEPMTEAQLAEHRGGLMTPLGLEVGFGATVRTFVDGTLALESKLTWTDAGAVQTSGAGTWTDLPAAAGGVTSVMHDLSNNRIASVVINTANDRVIRQETDITLHIPQLAAMQQQIAAERLANILADAAPR